MKAWQPDDYNSWYPYYPKPKLSKNAQVIKEGGLLD